MEGTSRDHPMIGTNYQDAMCRAPPVTEHRGMISKKYISTLKISENFYHRNCKANKACNSSEKLMFPVMKPTEF